MQTSVPSSVSSVQTAVSTAVRNKSRTTVHYSVQNPARNQYEQEIFRVVIVMTFRTTVGCLMERVQNLRRYQTHILHAIVELDESSGSNKRAIKKAIRTKLGNNNEWLDNVFKAAVDALHSERVIVKVNSCYKIYKGACANCRRK